MTTLREQIGQMLIMGFNGTQVDEMNPVKTWLSSDGLGGVLLFDINLAHRDQAKNLINLQQIVQLNSQLQYYGKTSQDLPLFIAIDYEGGYVDRLKNIPEALNTLQPKDLTDLTAEKLSLEIEKMATQLQLLGFNLNFAPVVDLNLNHREGIIGKLGRSFSADPMEVARVAKQFVNIFNKKGLACCYKHFPGHGSAVGDTHQGFVDVTNTFKPSELEPYYKLLTSHQDQAMIMTAHVINHHLDPSGLPATLSKAILTGLLREKMGFEGVIISDDLQMCAISENFKLKEALALTINAGADMVIFANQLDFISATVVIDTIEQLVKENIISVSRIEEAYQRILSLKHALPRVDLRSDGLLNTLKQSSAIVE